MGNFKLYVAATTLQIDIKNLKCAYWIFKLSLGNCLCASTVKLANITKMSNLTRERPKTPTAEDITHDIACSSATDVVYKLFKTENGTSAAISIIAQMF